MLLGEQQAVATVAVRDMKSARQFYENTLGLKHVDVEPEVVTYSAGKSKLFVYQSKFADTNKATAVTWVVGDEVDNLVRDLKAKGVKFEHYDMPNIKHEGDIHVSGTMRVAWFKDPDENIHSLVNGK